MNKNTFHTFHLYTCLKYGRIPIFSFFYSPFYYIHITCRCWYDNIIDIKDFLKLNKCIRTRNHIENVSFCKNHITEKNILYCNNCRCSFCSKCKKHGCTPIFIENIEVGKKYLK